MSRRINDGDLSGMKQDKFRHSDYENEKNQDTFRGVNRSDANTINGPYFDNRGRRGDTPPSHQFNPDSPFEDGELTNWANRSGWDDYYHKKSFREGKHGGGLIESSISFRGHGPKGYTRSDENIYEDACEVLSLSSQIDASGMEVTVRHGVVYLRGSVPNRWMKKMTEMELDSVSGVRDIQNQLRIS